MDQKLQMEILRTDDDEIIRRIKETNISQKNINDCLDKLENWFRAQPHLPNINKNDPFVLRSLYMASFSVEKAKSKLENLFAARVLKSEFFNERDPCSDEFSRVMNCLEYTIMPKRTKNDCRISIMRYKGHEVDFCDTLENFRLMLLLSDIRTRYDSTFNEIFIADFSKMNVGHAIRLNPVLTRNVMILVKNCYMFKVKGIHLINIPPFALNLLKMLKSLLKKKVSDRFFIHDNPQDIFKWIEPECLPKELGGTCGTCEEYSDVLYKAIRCEHWRKFLMDVVHQKTDESKRPKDQIHQVNETFGIDGSFRKLDID